MAKAKPDPLFAGAAPRLLWQLKAIIGHDDALKPKARMSPALRREIEELIAAVVIAPPPSGGDAGNVIAELIRAWIAGGTKEEKLDYVKEILETLFDMESNIEHGDE